MESMQHVSLSGERGWTASLWLVGKSRMLYVGTEERMLLYEIFLHYMKIHTQYPPPVLPTEHTDLPFDVKALTYEPIGLIPTRESSVLFEIILYQALEQTGGTTRDCRSCLQVHDFLLMEGWSAFYRKFLRISDIRELWAATRILSRGSMSSAHQKKSSEILFSLLSFFVVRLGGFELPTHGLGNRCSIHLSYRRIRTLLF